MYKLYDVEGAFNKFNVIDLKTKLKDMFNGGS